MKNSNTTIRELSRKYRSVLLKCALLNAMVIMGIMPALADTNVYTSDIIVDKNNPFDLGDYNIISSDELTMKGSESVLKFTKGSNNKYIDNVTLKGTVDFSTPNTGTNDSQNDGNNYNGPARTVHAVNVLFDNVNFIGYFNSQNKDADENGWENYNGFQANSLAINGNVNITNANVTMETESVKGDIYFNTMNISQAFDLTQKYTSKEYVLYNGGLYQTQEALSSASFMDVFYKHIATAVTEGTLSSVNDVPDYMKQVGLNTTYSAGDYIQVYATVKDLKTAGLIKSEDARSDTDKVFLVYQVNDGKEYTTLSVESSNTLQEILPPTDFETSVTIKEGSVVKLNSSNFAGETYLDPVQRLAKDMEELDAKSKYTGQQLEDILNGIDEKWSDLGIRNYSLPVTVVNSKVEIGNGSRIGKESSGVVSITGSEIEIWGGAVNGAGFSTGDLALDGFSSIDHFGFVGDVLITDSNLTLYSNSGILRSSAVDDPEGWFSDTIDATSKANVIANHSNINLYGSTKTGKFTTLVGKEEKNSVIAPTIIFTEAGEGNFQLTNNSSLNVYGDDNQIYIRNSNILGNNNSLAKKNALYVINSKINVEPKAKLSLYYFDSENGINGTNDALGGKIALDQGAIVNLKGTLDADIVSLTPTVKLTNGVITADVEVTDKFGSVNLYDGAKLNGTISGSNIYAKSKTTQFGGTLTAQNSVFDIGTNKLKGETLSLKDTLFVSTIASDGSYGSLDLNTLSFNNSLIRINVDLDAVGESGKTIQFANKDLGLESSDFYNTMYDMTYDNGQLTLRRNGNSGFISLKDLNEQMTASAWLKGGFSSSSPMMQIAQNLNNWMQTDPDKFARVVKQLKPTEGSQAQQTANSVNQQIAHAVGGRFGGAASGRSAGDTFKNVGAWAQGLYNKTKLDTTNGYTGKTKGISMGFDGILFDTTKLGFGYAYTTTDIDADGSDTDVDTHTAILYAEHNMGNAFVNAIGTYGYSKYDATRPTDLGMNVNSDYHMDSLYGQIMGGYHFDVAKKTTFTPEAGLRYLWTKAHDYEEKELDQKISSGTTNTWTGVLGGRIETQIQTKKGTFVPEFKLAATYDLKNDEGVSTVALANGSSYRMEGETLKRFGVETGLKLGMNVDNMEFSVNYEGRFKQDYTDHTGLLNFRYNF